MLQQLNHKHILRIRDHWENPKTNQLCFITDILQGGSLRELSIYSLFAYLVSIHCLYHCTHFRNGISFKYNINI